MYRVLKGLGLLLLATASAAAQDDVIAPEQPLSELDALSQSSDDPFSIFETTSTRKPVSVTLRALDKITAQYTDIEATMNEPVTFGSLEILPHFCDKRPPEEFPETTAFLEIFDRNLATARTGASIDLGEAEEAPTVEPEIAAEPEPVEADIAAGQETQSETVEAAGPDLGPVDPDRIFSGWMFASTPALNALEHPVYDVWVIDCKTVAEES